MAVLGTQKITVRFGHRDAACPAGYENGIFVLFGGHHGAGGYGAWIQEPEQFYAWQQEPAGPNNSLCGVQDEDCPM